jgi:zeaxanthin glucosyltransferase
MSRFLVHSLPLSGHANAIAAVAGVLADRGHEVAWAGSSSFLRPIVGPDTTIYPTGMRLYRGALRDHGLTSVKSRWEGYIAPVTKFMLPAVEAAVRTFQPDVLMVDQHAIAGALAAHRQGVAWATLVPSTAELADPYRDLPIVKTWIEDQITDMWMDAGFPGLPPHDLRYSPHLVLAFTCPMLAGPPPPGVEMVGAALARRPAVDFPWDRLDPAKKHVLVSVGTIGMDMAEDFFGRVAAALRPLADRVQAILIAPAELIPDPPADAVIVSHAPLLDLMPRLDAVLTHGGLNTVCEALFHGLPLVVAPIKSDQHINATQVAAAGAGIRVKFHRANPDQLRAAISAVLDEPSYRAAAVRVREDLRAAGGAEAAADRLVKLATAGAVA